MGNQTQNQDDLTWNFYRNPRQPYDEFVSNYILKPCRYQFVQRHYDRPLGEFARELPDLMHRFTTVHRTEGDVWLPEMVGLIEKAGIHDLFSFVDRVTTRAQAERFLVESGMPQDSLMDWMDYLKQWWFPFPATLRQLVEDDAEQLDAALTQLKAVKIANSFTLLDAAAEPADRVKLARHMKIDEAILLDLVQRADVSRLPYTSGGAVKRLWAMGYRSLAVIRRTDPQEYAMRAEAYFAAGGKGTTFDAKMPNILSFLQDARHAPEVVVE